MFSADTAWSELRGAHFVIRFVYPDFLLNVVNYVGHGRVLFKQIVAVSL